MPGVDDNAGWTLFLDFDGVLNNSEFVWNQRTRSPAGASRFFDPENIRVLNALCTGLPVTQIVVTSTWRQGRKPAELGSMLGREGFLHEDIVDAVTGASMSRAVEIQDFVDTHDPRRWFILDDMNLGSDFGGRFYRTSAAEGLTQEMCDKILVELGAHKRA